MVPLAPALPLVCGNDDTLVGGHATAAGRLSVTGARLHAPLAPVPNPEPPLTATVPLAATVPLVATVPLAATAPLPPDGT
jgi:hypothetical protein